MSGRYSLRQTPRKTDLYEGMVETPTRRSTRQQSSAPPSEPEGDSSPAEQAPSANQGTRSSRQGKANLVDAMSSNEDIKVAHANGNGATHRANGSSNKKEKKHENGPEAIDGWIPGQNPKVDYSGEFEFGGSLGTGAMMILFPILMWYMWIGATYYDGKVPSRKFGQTYVNFGYELVNLVYTGAFPHAKAWLWYWSYFVFEGILYCTLPGVKGWGKPLPHEDGKQLPYFCNAYASFYTTFAILGALHFTGVFPLQTVIDEFGPLLSVAICTGYIVAIIAYVSAFWRGKTHRMTGHHVYDFFMGAELNPRMFGILDFKMFFEVRMPWYILLIISLGTAARQQELYGYVSGEVWFLVMAHYLYANACAKGEELIITTWDMYYEKWGFMLIFWNLAGVPLSYCHCTIYLANHDPATYRWNRFALAAMFGAYLFWYWVWDSCNSQKNRFRAMEKGKLVARNTFPQVPWQTLKNPKTIVTPRGTILVDGWYGLARKIHYTADTWFAVSWGLITGFESPFPWFYPVFFVCMIAHRASRDISRCRHKYGEGWMEYERRVPYLFIPYII